MIRIAKEHLKTTPYLDTHTGIGNICICIHTGIGNTKAFMNIGTGNPYTFAPDTLSFVHSLETSRHSL